MRKPCRNRKPTLKPTLNRPQYTLKQPWTNPRETMSLWWPTRHAAGQSPHAPSGAVEGDWLRRGGWLTHCGLTLLVGDRFWSHMITHDKTHWILGVFWGAFHGARWRHRSGNPNPSLVGWHVASSCRNLTQLIRSPSTRLFWKKTWKTRWMFHDLSLTWSGWWSFATPLKNDGLRQLDDEIPWNSQYQYISFLIYIYMEK